jgi:hypothetical protein
MGRMRNAKFYLVGLIRGCQFGEIDRDGRIILQ